MAMAVRAPTLVSFDIFNGFFVNLTRMFKGVKIDNYLNQFLRFAFRLRLYVILFESIENRLGNFVLTLF